MQSRANPFLAAALATLLATACANDETVSTPFLQGTPGDPGIAIAVGSLGTTLHMLQTGTPDERREIALGTSSAITAVGFSVRDRWAAVPLGDAASVALVDLEGEVIDRYFTFPSGNATGSDWVGDRTVIACNPLADVCGRFTLDQASDEMTLSGPLTQFPTAVVTTASGRVFVISANLDDNYVPAGPGVVTELNNNTLEVIRTFTVGTNPQYGAIAGSGKLYVVNSGDFGMANGSLSVINLNTNTVESEVTGFGDFPGPLDIDPDDRVVVSSFSYGSVVWNAFFGNFVRDTDNPVCAPDVGGCRTASSAAFAPNGKLYQSFFGSAAAGLQAYYFVYNGSTFALEDSIPVPIGPSGLKVLEFE